MLLALADHVFGAVALQTQDLLREIHPSKQLLSHGHIRTHTYKDDGLGLAK